MKKQHFQTIFKTGTAILLCGMVLTGCGTKNQTKCNNQYYYGGEYSIGTADAVRGIKR